MRALVGILFLAVMWTTAAVAQTPTITQKAAGFYSCWSFRGGWLSSCKYPDCPNPHGGKGAGTVTKPASGYGHNALQAINDEVRRAKGRVQLSLMNGD